MLIGLIDCDIKNGKAKFPNFALMKISAYHKAEGDIVEWVDYLQQKHYNKVYLSKVFSFTPNALPAFTADEIITGGTGFDVKKKLPIDIETMKPDYSIYPHIDYAIGFLTRGCPNNCYFCVVPKKEGKITPYSAWREIKRNDSKKIIFMDNNVLAHLHGISEMQSMIGQDIRIDFNQGLDVTLVTAEIANLLVSLKWIEFIRFSCDKDYQMPYIKNAVKLLAEGGWKARNVFVYVLGTDFDGTYKRIEFLRELGVTPFLQPYIPIDGKQTDKQMRNYARYVNHKAVFNSISWWDYDYNYWKSEVI